MFTCLWRGGGGLMVHVPTLRFWPVFSVLSLLSVVRLRLNHSPLLRCSACFLWLVFVLLIFHRPLVPLSANHLDLRPYFQSIVMPFFTGRSVSSVWILPLCSSVKDY